jgi:hypothetical protein
MPDDYWPAMPQATAVDDQFGTHTCEGGIVGIHSSGRTCVNGIVQAEDRAVRAPIRHSGTSDS